jgi:hypothetical protein
LKGFEDGEDGQRLAKLKRKLRRGDCAAASRVGKREKQVQELQKILASKAIQSGNDFVIRGQNSAYTE